MSWGLEHITPGTPLRLLACGRQPSLAAAVWCCPYEFLAGPLVTMMDDTPVRQAVQAFYKAFDEGFVGANEFAAEDWDHINPFGGWAQGRDAVLQEVRQVHQLFLKDVTDTIEHMAVRFAAPDVAVATVQSAVSTFTTPDGVKHEGERNIRTFVVVQRAGRWLVLQDHNTVIRA